MRWFYHDGQQQVGPVDEAVLRSMAYDGRLQPSTPVWKEGTPSWTTAQQTELGSLFVAPPVMAPISKCPRCGSPRTGHSRFCPKCGAPLDTDSAPLSRTSQATAGTRDQTRSSDLIFPRNPPVSPHVAWLCLIWPGIPHLIHGQAGKGVVLMVSSFVSLIMPVLTFVLLLATTADAFMVGKVLRSGKPVGRWAWFPS